MKAEAEHIDYCWRLRKWRPDRHGQLCRIICRGRGPGPRNILVQFADGERVVTTWRAVRKREVFPFQSEVPS